jgi:hypothetical protein
MHGMFRHLPYAQLVPGPLVPAPRLCGLGPLRADERLNLRNLTHFTQLSC